MVSCLGRVQTNSSKAGLSRAGAVFYVSVWPDKQRGAGQSRAVEKIIRMRTVGSKIPFPSKGGRFCDENVLHYLDSCYVNSIYHKLKTFPLL